MPKVGFYRFKMNFNTLIFVGVSILWMCFFEIHVANAEIVCPVVQADDSFVIQFPSPTSCSVFYKCDRGVAILNECPEGLHYNTRIQVGAI